MTIEEALDLIANDTYTPEELRERVGFYYRKYRETRDELDRTERGIRKLESVIDNLRAGR